MALADTRDPRSLSTRLRKRRDVRLRGLISDIASEGRGVSIIDIGGTVEYWRRLGIPFLREQGVHVTLVNFVETELTKLDGDADVLESVVGNGCSLDMADGSFDLAHSNSVIEHVGRWDDMKAFAGEIRRVARSYYVQTPYFWFPVDPHFYKMPAFHWLPRPIRARLLGRFPLAYSGRMVGVDAQFAAVESAVLLDCRQMEFLFPDGLLSYEHFMGLRKSMIAVRRSPSDRLDSGS